MGLRKLKILYAPKNFSKVYDGFGRKRSVGHNALKGFTQVAQNSEEGALANTNIHKNVDIKGRGYKFLKFPLGLRWKN